MDNTVVASKEPPFNDLLTGNDEADANIRKYYDERVSIVSTPKQ